MASPVIFHEHVGLSGKRVGVIELNEPNALNALSLEMVDLMTPQLQQWASDPELACVLLSGQGQKAFCAGGDIRSLYEGMTGKRPADFCEQFFTREYRLDFSLHHYPKPIICWGSGFVIGGGIGLMSGCRYRVVTETSKLAMPEVSIGLFPDVAGSWFLNRMPGHTGRFIALTGAFINAEDSILCGLADYCVASQHRELLIERLVALEWSNEPLFNHHLVHRLLLTLQSPPADLDVHSQVLPAMAHINSCFGEVDITAAVNGFLQLATGDPWLNGAQQSLRRGSPSSIAIIDRQLADSRFMSLAEVYRSELTLSMNCTDEGEFAEGIRALLIDKDHSPQWRFKSIEAVPNDWLEAMFQPRWEAEHHPLADL